MAAQQNHILARQFETRPSTRGGTGLFSIIAQGAGHCIHYYGQFYENGHAVAEAQLADNQYIDSTIEQDNHCVKSMWGENHAHECFATLQIWLLVP
jgi:hypothetical protein